MCGLMRDPARLSGSVGVGLRPDIMLIGLACVIGLTAPIAIAWALRARKLNEKRTMRDYLQRIASREDADEAFPHSLVQAPREFRFRTRLQSFFKPAQWGKSGVRRVQLAKSGGLTP
jgi:hypothetical protein